MTSPRPRLPYRLLKSIGRGGYAEVFRAVARAGHKDIVALKKPHEFDEAYERMAREIRVQQGLQHPNIMPIIDAAEDGSWFVMPLAVGNLEYLWESGRLGTDPEPVVDAVLRSIGAGLEHAHLQGAIHRDVSPRNILAFDDGGELRWVLADWGMVKRPPGETTNRLTMPGVGAGTRGFAAPETWIDAHVADERADVYSLGRVAAWLLTGTRPIPNVPLRPDGPMRGFVVECTQHEPDRRIQSMAALLERLETLLAVAPASVAGQVQDLVDRAISDGVSVEADVMRIAMDHEDDADLFLDEVARLPIEQVERFIRADPATAAAAATTMLEHLRSADWGHRDFNYANVPLAWAHEVLKTLLDLGQHGPAEDLAVVFFQVETEWNRFKQKDAALFWLRNLAEPEGRVIARAMRRAGTHAYYSSLAGQRLPSRSLAAEFRRWGETPT